MMKLPTRRRGSAILGREGWILLALALVALALRSFRLGSMPLFSDEAYYLLWSKQLAPAYYDHGAGIAWLVRLSTLAGGAGEVGVRWLNLILATACVPLSYAVGFRYVNRRGGLISAAVVALAPGYVLTGRVAYPDALQSSLMLLNLLAMAPLLSSGGRSDQNRAAQWALFGLTMGLLLNTKLTSLFYAGALAAFVLLFRRDLLRQPGLWLAVAITALLWTPYVAWSFGHGWPALHHAIDLGRGFEGERPGLLGRLAHAWRYWGAPAAVTAGLAVGVTARRLVRGLRRNPGRPLQRLASSLTREAWLLLWCSAALALPVLASGADSPRNLGLGLLALWPLAGVAWAGAAGRTPSRRSGPAIAALFALLSAGHAVWAAGTVAALLGPTALPHGSAAPAVRRDAAGWPELAGELAKAGGGPVYAVDYSIAGQLAYYGGRPVYSSAGQFRIWGIPALEEVTVVAQGYLPPELVTATLRAGFDRVSGPEALSFADGDVDKVLYVWQASGRRAPMAQVVEDLDYLALARRARGPG